LTYIDKIPPLIAIFAITFWCGITDRNRIGILFCLFFLPYNVFAVKGHGFNAFAIMGLAFGYILKNFVAHRSSLKGLYYKNYIRLILLSFALSIVVLLIRQDYSDVSWFGIESIKSTSLQFIGTYFLCFFLYIIISTKIKSLEELFAYITAFVASSYYIFISWAGSFASNIGLPNFLQMRHSGGGYDRFSSFWGDYELTNEYFFIVLIFSIVVLFSKDSNIYQKVISLGAIIISLPLAVSTGTRSFLVMSFVFIIVSSIFYILRRKISITKKVSFTIVSLLVIIFAHIFISRNILFSGRLEQALMFAQSGGRDIYTVEKIVNRSYLETYQDILEVGGPIGIGSVFVHSVRGSDMVYHCLYYALIIQFGVIGLIIYLTFFARLFKDLYRNYKLENKLLQLMLFCLLLSLLVDEIKINFMRQPSQMFIYWFLFAIITVVNKGFGYTKITKSINDVRAKRKV